MENTGGDRWRVLDGIDTEYWRGDIEYWREYIQNTGGDKYRILEGTEGE